MSILSGITAGKVYNINGVDLELKSVHVDKDVESLLEGKKDVPIGEQIELMKTMVKKMLKDSIPDATEQELEDSTRLRTLLPLIDAFYDVCGMTDEKNLSNAEKIKSAIEQRRESIARAQSETKK